MRPVGQENKNVDKEPGNNAQTIDKVIRRERNLPSRSLPEPYGPMETSRYSQILRSSRPPLLQVLVYRVPARASGDVSLCIRCGNFYHKI